MKQHLTPKSLEPTVHPLYAGPYRVVNSGEKCFLIEVGGKQEAVSEDRLKPHLGKALESPVMPPARRRPPKLPPSSLAVSPSDRHWRGHNLKGLYAFFHGLSYLRFKSEA